MNDRQTLGHDLAMAFMAAYGDGNFDPAAVPLVCAVIGGYPDTPLANVAILHPGQHVVEKRELRAGERHLTKNEIRVAETGWIGAQWVVVRSATAPPDVLSGDQFENTPARSSPKREPDRHEPVNEHKGG